MANPRYKKNQKNGGNIPPVNDQRTLFVPIGCGNCIECRKQNSRQWQVRLIEDIKTHTDGQYITLTMSNESYTEIAMDYGYLHTLSDYDLDNRIITTAIRLFLERWRKMTTYSLRHWLVSELGHNGTENIHMHGIIWHECILMDRYTTLKTLQDKWNYGYIWPRTDQKQIHTYVNEKTINYIVKYITKIDKDHPNYKSIVLATPGIGREYTTTYNAQKNKFAPKSTNELYRTRTGHKLNLPIYWRNKLYTDDQREQLWLQKLDKQERWVLGQKIDISKGEDEYNKALQYAQKKNERLGYGKLSTTWEEKEYEKQRRNLKIAERIQNAYAASEEFKIEI